MACSKDNSNMLPLGGLPSDVGIGRQPKSVRSGNINVLEVDNYLPITRKTVPSDPGTIEVRTDPTGH
jgi:hypothetical protein